MALYNGITATAEAIKAASSSVTGSKNLSAEYRALAAEGREVLPLTQRLAESRLAKYASYPIGIGAGVGVGAAAAGVGLSTGIHQMGATTTKEASGLLTGLAAVGVVALIGVYVAKQIKGVK